MQEQSCSQEERAQHSSQVLAALANNSTVPTKERGEVEARLTPLLPSEGLALPSDLRSQGSKDSLSSIRSSKKRAAPQPPRQQGARSSSGERGPSPALQDCRGPSPLLRELPEGSPSPRSCSMDTATTTGETLPEDSPVPQPSLESPRSAAQLVTVTYKQPQDSCHTQVITNPMTVSQLYHQKIANAIK